MRTLTRALAGVLSGLTVTWLVVSGGEPTRAADSPAATADPAVPPPDPAAQPPAPFGLARSRVSPARAFFAGRPVRIDFQISAPTALDLQVQVARQPSRRVVRRFTLAAVAPLLHQRIEWDGLTDRGRVAPNGRYVVRVVAAGDRARRAGALSWHSHVYPVRGPHSERGAIGRFGAARSGGRIHEGFDVNAACGTPLVAARGGRVVRNIHDPVLYGNLLIVRGLRTRRDYWYSHLQARSPLRAGDSVRTGGRIGRVGATGNARTVGCHLHFEIHRSGVPINPAPELHLWDGWS